MNQVIANQFAEAIGGAEVLTLDGGLDVTGMAADGIGGGFSVAQEFAQLIAQAWDGEEVEQDAVSPRTGGSREVCRESFFDARRIHSRCRVLDSVAEGFELGGGHSLDFDEGVRDAVDFDLGSLGGEDVALGRVEIETGGLDDAVIAEFDERGDFAVLGVGFRLVHLLGGHCGVGCVRVNVVKRLRIARIIFGTGWASSRGADAPRYASGSTRS